MTTSESQPDPSTRVESALISAISIVSVLLAGLGYNRDVVMPRMVHNYPWLVGIGIGALFAASLVGLAALTMAGRRAKRNQRGLLRLGLALMFAGGLAVAAAAIATANTRSLPSVTAAVETAENTRALHIVVSARNLPGNEHVLVVAQGLFPKNAKGAAQKPVGLYSASLGPDDDGNVNREVTVALPPGDYTDVRVLGWTGDFPEECLQLRTNTTGCVTIRVLREPERPQLTARFSGKKDRLLRFSITARDIPNRRVFAQVRQGSRKNPIAEWLLAPSVDGTFARSLRLRLPASLRRVCIIASSTETDLTCPPDESDSASAWVRLFRPK